ncbi:hypothetical protein [Paenibacillus sp. Soil787]|uniref:hypothetical protein n=1 Tax=Paenibacillus sp. Soil787 TaxID=1736411 RepID=UPI000702F0D5|nr:hypothetical protein [Paenibacillus sp. Soil787]KRF18653.1 hypothetical protein ASG93_11490 [Paenibacillus sp. Soil787]
MQQERSYEDQTSASKKEVGFGYQFFYFIYLLLQLKPNEVIGFEVKDDIHIELPNGALILIQAKHSLQKKADNSTKNLTERDNDLWKTLFTWSKMINDKALGRTAVGKQLDFIKNARFILVTNKNESAQNKFLDKLSDFQNKKISIVELRSIIQGLIDASKPKEKDTKLESYMKALINQKDQWLSAFLKKVEIRYNQDELLELIRNDIKVRVYEINEFRLDMAFDCIISNLSCWRYDQVKRDERIEISYDDVEKKLSKCFFNARRTDKLPRRNFDEVLPDNFEDQTFIKQLIEIGEVTPGDLPKMADLTTFKININKHLDMWVQSGEITEDEREDFHDQSVLYWEACFQESHLSSEDLDPSLSSQDQQRILRTNAKKCLIAIKKTKLTIDKDELDLKFSNGEFYWLSDQPRIGWTFDWKGKYKK